MTPLWGVSSRWLTHDHRSLYCLAQIYVERLTSYLSPACPQSSDRNEFHVMLGGVGIVCAIADS